MNVLLGDNLIRVHIFFVADGIVLKPEFLIAERAMDEFPIIRLNRHSVPTSFAQDYRQFVDNIYKNATKRVMFCWI